MIQTRIVVYPTRRVRDLLRRQRFRVVRRFPGGREIDLGTAENRERAVKVALAEARPGGSPTAPGGVYVPGYAAGDPVEEEAQRQILVTVR